MNTKPKECLYDDVVQMPPFFIPKCGGDLVHLGQDDEGAEVYCCFVHRAYFGKARMRYKEANTRPAELGPAA